MAKEQCATADLARDVTVSPSEAVSFARRVAFRESRAACWEWKAGANANGYGVFYCGGETVPAHRASFVIFNGPIPRGKVIDHLCRNPRCVNPYHLEAVSQEENVRRGLLPTAQEKPRMCRRGHVIAGANAQIKNRGAGRERGVECRICRTAITEGKTSRQRIKRPTRRQWRYAITPPKRTGKGRGK